MDGTVLTSEQKEKFESKLRQQTEWYGRGQRLWSLTHHATLFISALSSAAAAVIPQLEGFASGTVQKNLTSILAGSATVLISLNTAGSFGKKWRANRVSKSKVEQLSGELIAREPTTTDIDRLNQVESDHDKEVAG
jgi:hypothetical protein